MALLPCGCETSQKHDLIVEVSWKIAAEQGLALETAYERVHEMVRMWPVIARWANTFREGLARRGLKLSDNGAVVPMTAEEMRQL